MRSENSGQLCLVIVCCKQSISLTVLRCFSGTSSTLLVYGCTFNSTVTNCFGDRWRLFLRLLPCLLAVIPAGRAPTNDQGAVIYSFNSSVKADSVNGTTPCPASYYCPGGNPASTVDSNRGLPVPCPDDKTSPVGSDDSSDCTGMLRAYPYRCISVHYVQQIQNGSVQSWYSLKRCIKTSYQRVVRKHIGSLQRVISICVNHSALNLLCLSKDVLSTLTLAAHC